VVYVERVGEVKVGEWRRRSLFSVALLLSVKEGAPRLIPLLRFGTSAILRLSAHRLEAHAK
jgi:hypothetical protein